MLVDCFMNALTGSIPENTAGGIGDGRQLAVSKCLRWDIGRARGAQKIKWKEVESRHTVEEEAHCRHVSES